MRVFMFPGQGAQQRGMGAGLFDDVSEFKQSEEEINRLLGFSPRELSLQDTDGKLQQTQYTQPCLFIVNALHYYKARAAGNRPDFLVGHSLGEYNALLASGAFDLLTGLRLVKRRAELMAQAPAGAMAAVIGLPAPRIAALLQNEGLSSIDIANFNSPGQIVLSGPPEALKLAGGPFEKAGAQAFVQLPVSGAFHSRYMFDAMRSFASFLEEFIFKSLTLPVLANATGRPYPVNGNAIRQLLAKQIGWPVQWTRIVRYLIDQGATSFEEIGPGNTLTRFVEHISKPK